MLADLHALLSMLMAQFFFCSLYVHALLRAHSACQSMSSRASKNVHRGLSCKHCAAFKAAGRTSTFHRRVSLAFFCAAPSISWCSCVVCVSVSDAGPPDPASHLRQVFNRMGFNDQVGRTLRVEGTCSQETQVAAV